MIVRKGLTSEIGNSDWHGGVYYPFAGAVKKKNRISEMPSSDSLPIPSEQTPEDCIPRSLGHNQPSPPDPDDTLESSCGG